MLSVIKKIIAVIKEQDEVEKDVACGTVFQVIPCKIISSVDSIEFTFVNSFRECNDPHSEDIGI
jgi:hypothetical protein